MLSISETKFGGGCERAPAPRVSCSGNRCCRVYSVGLLVAEEPNHLLDFRRSERVTARFLCHGRGRVYAKFQPDIGSLRCIAYDCRSCLPGLPSSSVAEETATAACCRNERLMQCSAIEAYSWVGTGAGFASSTPRAQLAIRASSPSARLVRTIGTLAPTTTPAASAPARY